MAPYDPPCTHYSHLKVNTYNEDLIYAFIGKHGRRFYRLTDKLGMFYIWYNKADKIIELWGPYESMLRDPVSAMKKELTNFAENVYISSQGSGVQEVC